MVPYASVKPCYQPGCPALTHDTYCPDHRQQHERAANRGRATTKQRGYSGHWRKLRLLVLNKQPVCRMCKKAPSTEVDHILPKAQGGSNKLENLQGLCKPCHSRKTASEGGGW